jgi:hypothetical protein
MTEEIVEQSGLLEFLNEEKNDGGISNFFVTTIADTLGSLTKYIFDS